MSDGTVIIVGGDDESIRDIDEVVEAAEIEAEAEVEAVEEVTDAAVQIAEIEANRDIIIAEIQAEVQTAAVEAVETESEDKWQILQVQVSSLSEQVANLTAALSTPPASPEPPQSQTPPSASDAPEVTPESLAGAKAEEPPKRRKTLRWI